MISKIISALNNGFSAIPWLTIEGETKPRKFKANKYPLDHNAWVNYPHSIFSIHLQNTILIDIDANKHGAESVAQLTEKLCDVLGIDEFDLDLAEFQRNDNRDSLHYLFKAPDGFNSINHQQSNDGKLIKNIDFKTGNQLVHIKEGKTVTWQNVDDLPELTAEQYTAIFGKEVIQDDANDLLAIVNAQPDDTLTDDDVKRTLDKIDISVVDHDQWFRIGLGISHQYENSEKGKEIFKEFSQRFGDEYDEQEIDSRWPTFKVSSKVDRVTFKSVSAMVHINERESLKKTLVDDEYRQRANELVGYVSETILKETGFNIKIDRDTVQLMLKGAFWNANQAKINTTNNADELVIFPEAKSAEMLVTRFGQPVLNMADFITQLTLLDLSATEIRRYKSLLMSKVISSIQFNSQGDSLTYSVDMFSDRTYFDVSNSSVRVNFKYSPLTLSGKHYRVECEQSVLAYKKHFPEVEQLLDMIVASRFASSRKKAYVWLKCPSDWGKDVFRNALGAFHFEMSVSEVEKALEGSPVGKTAKSMFRAFAMVTNEFKKVKSELKQLEDDITVSAKYQLETSVPLYTKLFMSAEGVDSLMGEYGVEDQFANRFSMIEGQGKLNELAEFKKFGNTHFVNAVTTYITDYINNSVDEYRMLGRVGATSKGDLVVEQFHKTYGLKNKSNSIGDSMAEIAEEVRSELVRIYELDAVRVDSILYLKGAKTKIQKIIREGDLFTQSERYTIAHKADEIMVLISSDGEGSKARKIKGKTIRCLDVPIEPDEEMF